MSGVKDPSDKVLQHNGGGSLTIKDFQADTIGKLYRSCGNCKTQYKRSVTLNNVKLTNVKVAVVGINSNYGDTATIKGLTLVGKKVPICEKYQGTNNNSQEPKALGDGADGKNCIYSTSDVKYQ
uniref:Probable pectate lyase F n=1 Tax=Ditylenchus dipsaci TaxID=166011 RepID=A0A915ENE0_9BILA